MFCCKVLLSGQWNRAGSTARRGNRRDRPGRRRRGEGRNSPRGAKLLHSFAALLFLFAHILITCSDVFQALVLVAGTLGDNAVIKRNVRRAVMQLANFKPGRRQVGDVKPFALPARGEEHVR